jgi:hypothetical protein
VAANVVAADDKGRAVVSWTLGRAIGPQRLEIRVEGRETADTVRATALPAAAANIVLVSPPASAKPAAPVRITALVTDAYGNPVPDAMVSFTATGGTMAPARVMSDPNGKAMVRWTPGTAPAAQAVTASVRGTNIKTAQSIRVATASR